MSIIGQVILVAIEPLEENSEASKRILIKDL